MNIEKYTKALEETIGETFPREYGEGTDITVAFRAVIRNIGLKAFQKANEKEAREAHRALVLFSGGLDSTTCLAQAVERYRAENVVALSARYGQVHEKELQAAKKIVAFYGVKHRHIDLTAIFEGSDCSLIKTSGKDIPEGEYSEQLKNGAISTYVPFRNGLFLSAATAIAIEEKCDCVIYGAHRDDAAGDAYPDCSEAFGEAIGEAIWLGSGKQVRLEAPFIGKNKADIVAEGLRLNVPYELTWSCYKGGEKPCGVCGTCRDRAAAFEKNGAKDPLK